MCKVELLSEGKFNAIRISSKEVQGKKFRSFAVNFLNNIEPKNAFVTTQQPKLHTSLFRKPAPSPPLIKDIQLGRLNTELKKIVVN